MENKHINMLVVEDDPVDRQRIRRTIAESELAVNIDEVDTASKALQVLKSSKFDVALVDYKLPDGTAISILKSLTAPIKQITPIIVLTVHAQKSVALEALKEGAQDFLPKDSINADVLERSIRYSIERNQLFREVQWAREKEQREKELLAIQAAVEAESKAPPAVKDSRLAFEQFVAEYEQLLRDALEVAAYKISGKVAERAFSLAEKLGNLHAGPKDVIDIHTAALHRATLDARKEREEALTAEGRILLVQLMGYLVSFYRNKVM